MDWKMLAAARGLTLTDDEIARLSAPLDTLERSWRPLLAKIPFETEPAVMMRCDSIPSNDGDRE